MPRVKRKIGVDTHVYDLAEFFLYDIDKSQYQNDVIEQLAMHLQQEIEDWLNYDLETYRKKDDEQ